MKHLVLGTAGHVDHGKTALVKALTGVDTDRLEEEKRRGITIVPGYAELCLGEEVQLGIVDVPGHERFIHNMLSGIGGIDLVLLVVAADEGVMPQTREHFDICRLLDVRRGLTAVTKIDLVEEEWLALVLQDVQELVRGTFLESGGIFPVSARTGEGLSELVEGIRAVTTGIPERESGGVLRLPVDRVFTMKGFGTVVTGTLVSGRVHSGQTVEILPSGRRARVRGVQVHSRPVDQALAGQRTALNLQGVETGELARGQTVTAEGLLRPTYMLDAAVALLPEMVRPLKQRSLVRFHIGTSRTLANLVLLDREELVPGERAYAQLRLRGPVVAMGGDRFILRSVSENRTIGGGQVLDPLPAKHRASETGLVEALERLEQGSPEDKAEVFLRHAGFDGMDLAGFRCRLPLGEAAARRILQRLREKGRGVTVQADTRHLLHVEHDRALRERILSVLDGYHRSRPLEAGMPKAELLSRFARIVGERVLISVLERMVREGSVGMEEKRVRRADHAVRLDASAEEAASRIQGTYVQAGLTPPYARDLPRLLDLSDKTVTELLRLLVEQGRLVRVQGDLYFDAAALDRARDALRRHLEVHGEISVPQVRELLGATRKYLIPLLEYFDAQGFTARKGDNRVLR